MEKLNTTLIIFVRTKEETTIPVRIQRQAKVSELKVHLQINYGIDGDTGFLSFKNQHLIDNKSLGEYDINNGAVLHAEAGGDQEEIMTFLVKGGFGEVYLMKKNDKIQVNKKINLKDLNDKCRKMAIQEMKLLENLNHPNIVSYEGGYQKQDCLHIIMEYCSGGDLAVKIHDMKEKKQVFKEQEILSWIGSVAEALAYIHNRKIIHRDIKPANIFLSGSGTVKLGDFGISRVLGDEATRASTLIGTPLYTAPEAWTEGFTTKSDIFSLGCCLYELAALKSSYPYVKVVLPESYSDNFKSLAVTLLDHEAANRPDANQVVENPIFMTEAQKAATLKVRRRRTTTNVAKQVANQNLKVPTPLPRSTLTQGRSSSSEKSEVVSEQYCLQSLTKFNEQSKSGLVIDKKKVVEEIILSMRNFKHNADLQILGCSSLAYVSREKDKNVLTPSVRSELCDVLTSALENHPTRIRLVILCAMRLDELGKRHELILRAKQLVPTMLQYTQMTDDEMSCRIGFYILYLISQGMGCKQNEIMNKLGTIKALMNIITSSRNKDYYKNLLPLFWGMACNLTDETPENCKEFVQHRCLPFLIETLTMIPKEDEWSMSVWITMSNISEVEELKPQLLKSDTLAVLVKHLDTDVYSDQISSEAAQILVNLLSDGERTWSVPTPQRDFVVSKIVEAIDKWDIDSSPPSVYRTFRPLWLLTEASHTPVCQYWAVWTLAKLTRCHPDRYCPMIEEEKGIERLLSVVQSSTTLLIGKMGSYRSDPVRNLSASILQLTGKILNACEDYKKYKGGETKNRNLIEMLIEATSDGDLEDVEQLIKANVYLNAKSSVPIHEGRSAIHFATEKGHIDVVRALVGGGAFVHAADVQGMTALHIAAWEGHFQLVKLLLIFGANPEAEAKTKGWKIVHFAAAGGHLPILKYLTETCDIKSLTRDKKTALHLAAEYGKEDVAKWLIDEGIDFQLKDAASLSALEYAIHKNHTSIARLLKGFSRNF